MRRTPRRFVVSVLVAALVAGLSVAGATAKSNETVTLTLLESTTGRAATEILIANFKRVYPDINIQAQYLTSTQLHQVLLTQMQANNTADMFRVSGGFRQDGVWELAQAGRLLDLTGATWNARIYPSSRKYFGYKGKVYAWPYAVSPFAALYNVDLFKQLGLKVPTRMSEVLALCKKITAAGKVPFAQGWADPSTANVWIPQRMTQYVYSVDPNWDTKRANKQVTFASSPLWRAALQSIVDMKDAGCFQPGTQGSTRAQGYQLFSSGGAVMTVIAAPELPNVLAGNPNLHYEMFNLPSDNPKNARVYMPAPNAIAASAATKYPRQVKTFIAFVAREQQNRLFNKIGGTIAPLDVKKLLLPDYIAPLRPLIKAGKIGEANHFGWPPGVFDEAFAPAVVGLITGQETVQSVLARVDTAWDSPR